MTSYTFKIVLVCVIVYDLRLFVYKLKVTRCLADVGLTAERDVLSKKLSGGQKRKLSLAMAIIGDPQVLY